LNLRDFCKTGNFQSVLMTTFNFDPLFFERVVLRDLIEGGANNIVVLADEGQATSAFQSVMGQLEALGRRYRVLPIKMAGAFHPKICLRMSNTGAVIYCGSANLSRSGWLGLPISGIKTGNREIGMNWKIEPGGTDVSILQQLQSNIQHLFQTENDKDNFNQLFHYEWIKANIGNEDKDWNWLLTGIQKSLSAELEDRWEGRKFDSLKMVSGSTDESAEMIRWAVKTFGIQHVTIEIDIERCSFNTKKLKGIPVKLDIKPLGGCPHTHLKVALFESKTESALVAGSANCSGAGWLRNKTQNGNVESVVVFDNVNPKELAHLFTKDVKAKGWEQAGLTEKQNETQESSDSTFSYCLQQLILDRDLGTIQAIILPLPKANSKVELEILNTGSRPSSRVNLKCQNNNGLYSGMQPDIPLSRTTTFGRVLIHHNGDVLQTNEVWINELDQLRSFRNKKIQVNLQDLQRGGTSSQNNALLSGISGLVNTILDVRSDYSDGFTKPTFHLDKKRTSADPISLEELIISIDTLKPRHETGANANAYGATLSFSGILRTLFVSEEQSSPEMTFDPTESEHKKSDEEKNKDAKDDQDYKSPETVEPTEEQCQKLIRQLRKFVDALQEPIFAETCSAYRLREAAVFPIAVSRWTYNSPWMSKEVERELASIVRETCETLLLRRKPRVRRGDKKPIDTKPLIEEVHGRYLKENRSGDFNNYIGDGRLLLVLTAAVVTLQSIDSQPLETALLLRDLNQFEVLRSAIQLDSFAVLAKKIDMPTSFDNIIQNTSGLAVSLKSLEEYLMSNQDSLKTPSGNRPKAGDWLWNSSIGFARIEELQEQGKAKVHIRKKAKTIPNILLHFYVNLRIIAKTDTRLRELLHAIDHA